MASKLLPDTPAIHLEIARDRSPDARATGGFLNVRRLDLILHFPDGSASAPFPFDVGYRAALDAVVFVAHFRLEGVAHVYLRSAVRPACALRSIPPAHDGRLWEVPAGLIEPGEDAVTAAVRELEEELGFVVPPSAMKPLGPWTFPSPGVIAERHIFFAVEVDPSARKTPTEDASALERGASIIAIPLADALAHCRAGAIQDAKTELALRRLAEVP